jgi:hypothetical protein
VVVVAAGAHAVEVGAASVCPDVDVVDLAVIERDIAAGVEAAGRVAGSQRHALGSRGQPAFSSHVEGLSGAVEDDGDDPGLTRDPPDGLHRQRVPAVGFRGASGAVGTGSDPVDHRVEVDEHHDRR